MPYGEFPDEVRAIVRNYIPADCEYLITTWLDNDDAIHKEVVHGSNYINVYRRSFRVPTGKILDNFSIKVDQPSDGEKTVLFLLEQAKISVFFPYYFLRKVFLMVKHKQLDELMMSRFAVKIY